MIPEIRRTFTNNQGIYYGNVREIAYKKGQLFGNLGEFVGETKHQQTIFFDESDNLTEGVYIYRTKLNPNVAYRIYKSFADYGFNGYQDDKLIQTLQERQPHIQTTEFPTGVVTLEGNIIGQEIPYYGNSQTLAEKVELVSNKQIITYYIEILRILRELLENGIIYSDIHSKNFMIDIEREVVRLIDFDKQFISFDENRTLYNNMINNLKTMINKINNYRQIGFALNKESRLNDIEETIYVKTRHLT